MYTSLGTFSTHIRKDVDKDLCVTQFSSQVRRNREIFAASFARKCLRNLFANKEEKLNRVCAKQKKKTKQKHKQNLSRKLILAFNKLLCDAGQILTVEYGKQRDVRAYIFVVVYYSVFFFHFAVLYFCVF